jgi:type II secretory ATPase GspE/PulE/Tfp pilus assembly ATPase PilB-like protein
LAVADGKTVALLVADILDDAVAAGATAIHIAPGGGEFHVAYRVAGTLRTVASAPRSMSRPLIEGFLGFGGIAASTATPRVGRAVVRVSDRDVEIGVSLVRTLAGDRLVASLSDPCGAPRLDTLGMDDADVKTLRDIARTRGGLVVIAAAAGQGATTTYRAFLAECAAAGRAVHSVESIAGRLLDDVAQVVADDAAGGAAACLRAALEQDADVVGLDGLGAGGELDAIWSAVGRGLLAVVTVQAPDRVSAVLRMTGAGASEAALNDGLAAVVSQRLTREAGVTSAVFEVAAADNTRVDAPVRVAHITDDADDAALLVRHLAESA